MYVFDQAHDSCGFQARCRTCVRSMAHRNDPNDFENFLLRTLRNRDEETAVGPFVLKRTVCGFHARVSCILARWTLLPDASGRCRIPLGEEGFGFDLH